MNIKTNLLEITSTLLITQRNKKKLMDLYNYTCIYNDYTYTYTSSYTFIEFMFLFLFFVFFEYHTK